MKLDRRLGIWTREADTQDWARLHNNIGIAYWGRIRGERADNQEEAIAHYEAALTVFTRDADAREWNDEPLDSHLRAPLFAAVV